MIDIQFNISRVALITFSFNHSSHITISHGSIVTHILTSPGNTQCMIMRKSITRKNSEPIRIHFFIITHLFLILCERKIPIIIISGSRFVSHPSINHRVIHQITHQLPGKLNSFCRIHHVHIPVGIIRTTLKRSCQ